LGGQVRLATLAPNKDELKRITSFLMREMPRLSVDVRLSTEATVDLIRSLEPDAVIVAAGAAPPKVVRGLEEDEMKTNQVDAWDILLNDAPVGLNVIVVGGGTVGLEIAQFLQAQGKNVTVIEAQERVGVGMVSSVLAMALSNLKDAGAEIFTRTRVISLLSDGVVVQDANGEKRVINSDTIVKAVGTRRPEHKLMADLQSAGIPFCSVGDCAGDHARQLLDAIHEGFKAGLEI
jgi:pyruvate/2-oxoglutarate dehydrogenase complex dihydrolipoamide dehydrogenase (E3) component